MKKLISIVLAVTLITTSIPPKAAEASFFTDLMGGFFTILTAPIWVFCPNNPTFRKNNPFRKKVWEEERDAFNNLNNSESRNDGDLSSRLASKTYTIVSPKDEETHEEIIFDPSQRNETQTSQIAICKTCVTRERRPVDNKAALVEVETKETDLTEFLKTLKIVDNIKVRKQSPVPIIPAKTTALVEVEEPEKTKEATPAQGTPAGQTPEEKKVYLIMLVDQEDRIDLSSIKIIDNLPPPTHASGSTSEQATKHVTALVLMEPENQATAIAVDGQDIDLSKIKIIDSLPPIKIDLPLLEIIDKLPKLARGEATRAPVTPTLKEMEELLKETSSGGNTTNTTKPFKKHKTIKAQVPPPPPQTVLEIVRESLDKMISKYSPRVKAFWKKCKTAMMPTQEEIDRYNARIEELIVQNSLIEKLREEERKNDTPKNQRDDL